MMENLEMQKYLLDLQGYIVIENALSMNEMSALNALLDQNALIDHRDVTPSGMGGRFDLPMLRRDRDFWTGGSPSATFSIIP